MNVFKEFNLIDLTQTLDENVPTWTGDCGFKRTVLADYSEYHCVAGAGTHIDAPSHFLPNGRNVDELTLEELCTPICVVDMSAQLQPTAKITLQDFENFEKTFGKIPQGSVVLGHTGWSRYWKTPEKYRGKGKSPIAPTIDADVGELLIQRGVAGIGIDTLSPDPCGGSYPIHVRMLKADKFILENLTNLEKLPKTGSYLIALPLKIAKGTESPIRAIAMIPKTHQ